MSWQILTMKHRCSTFPKCDPCITQKCIKMPANDVFCIVFLLETIDMFTQRVITGVDNNMPIRCWFARTCFRRVRNHGGRKRCWWKFSNTQKIWKRRRRRKPYLRVSFLEAKLSSTVCQGEMVSVVSMLVCPCARYDRLRVSGSCNFFAGKTFLAQDKRGGSYRQLLWHFRRNHGYSSQLLWPSPQTKMAWDRSIHPRDWLPFIRPATCSCGPVWARF